VAAEWLFAKLYTAPSRADRLLREVVRPLVDRALATGAADSWFFIHYGDPDSHLRLRLHGDPTCLHAEALPALRDALGPLVADLSLRRVQLDTYDREIERYGGPEEFILSEQLFTADSQAVLEIVETLGDEALADARWRLAIPGMDVLLDDLGLGLEERAAVMKTVHESFAREHRADQKLLRQIGDRYRAEPAVLEPLLDPVGAADGPYDSRLARARGAGARRQPAS
jgi:class I lanthipeptide synthase